MLNSFTASIRFPLFRGKKFHFRNGKGKNFGFHSLNLFFGFQFVTKKFPISIFHLTECKLNDLGLGTVNLFSLVYIMEPQPRCKKKPRSKSFNRKKLSGTMFWVFRINVTGIFRITGGNRSGNGNSESSALWKLIPGHIRNPGCYPV